jgi:hypothetical protein
MVWLRPSRNQKGQGAPSQRDVGELPHLRVSMAQMRAWNRTFPLSSSRRTMAALLTF